MGRNLLEKIMNEKRIARLETLIHEAQEAYYLGNPIMSDEEYDALFDELQIIDPHNPVLKKVGAPPPSDTILTKRKHAIPMGSQRKVNTQQDFVAWATKSGADEFVIQEKLDGLSIELVYKQGKLEHAITRGDGEEGEDVTHTVRKMRNVPITLDGFTGSIRGEIIMRKSTFETKIKDDPKYAGLYANPRNSAAGLTRRKTTHPIVSFLWVIPFDVDSHHDEFKTEADKLSFMHGKLGLKCVRSKTVDVASAIKRYNGYARKQRGVLDYDIDGLVIKVNNIQRQKLLGEVDNRPKGQIAWKFAAEMRKTHIITIEWDTALSGRISPVGVFEPVEVGGATLERASLHHVKRIKELGLYPNAQILVSRRNEVIPHIEKTINPYSRPPFKIPTECPVCGGDVEFEGEFLMCASPTCVAKQRGNIKKWVKVIGIDEVGEKFIDSAVDSGYLLDSADLYALSADSISALDRQGTKSAKKILTNINKHRVLPLAKFMGALNIPNVSTSTFEALEASGFDSLETLQKAKPKDFLNASGIGTITANALFQGLQEKSKLISKLLLNGVSIKKKVRGKLSGQSFCFTGQISIKRGDAYKLVESLGGEIKPGVSKGLTYLVQSNPKSTSGKTKKAQKYGTKVIGEKEFMDLIDFSIKKLRSLQS
jgi:DNA ligase (NAD+)